MSLKKVVFFCTTMYLIHYSLCHQFLKYYLGSQNLNLNINEMRISINFICRECLFYHGSIVKNSIACIDPIQNMKYLFIRSTINITFILEKDNISSYLP